MRRFQLFEILDQHWCPQPVRDGATDFLEFVTNATDLYSSVRDHVLQAISNAGSTSVVDLCCGGGGPWFSQQWRAAIGVSGGPKFVYLTDKFPSQALYDRLSQGATELQAITYSVDATSVPRRLRGFRTIFASFHHFPDAVATEVLADAVRAGEGIASAEITSRTFKAIIIIGFTFFLCLIVTPFIRPFRVSRFVLTYLLPAIPLTVLWDGIVSCLRTRTPEELRALTVTLPEYSWTAGYSSMGRPMLPIVYLIGSPNHGEGAQVVSREA